MKKYYLIWKGYKNTNIVGFRSLDTLTKCLNKLIYTYDKDLEFQIIYGEEIFLDGDYYDQFYKREMGRIQINQGNP